VTLGFRRASPGSLGSGVGGVMVSVHVFALG
jgi:hypothetical protein